MGAATTFFAIHDDPSICAAVVDSPFCSLPILLKEIIRGFPIPKSFQGIALWCLRRRIQKRAQFNVEKVIPEQVAAQCSMPIFMIHAKCDDLINSHHSRRLFQQYGGSRKKIRIVSGNHGSRRPTQVICEAATFIANILEVNIQLHGLRRMIGTATHHFQPFESQI
jgi:hypothetical protein